ncbi:phosphatidate cytidylyltransferase, partial [Mycobacterium tuberculosis]|nr:phosphatidate cytidylyltransferase [Mycobacterium tuberculosis]
VGKLFGKRKIAPQLSPSKTIEGFVGGGLLATLCGASLYRVTPFSFGSAFGISLAIVIAGFVGGLVLSAVKRSLGAKDWGSMIAGHGGMLDRVDSICFAAPVFFHLVRYLYV